MNQPAMTHADATVSCHEDREGTDTIQWESKQQ